MRIRNNGSQAIESAVKYSTNEELPELENPSLIYKSLESNLGEDHDWLTHFNTLNELRSLVKFNIDLFTDQNYYLVVFKKVRILLLR